MSQLDRVSLSHKSSSLMKLISQEELYTSFEAESREAWSKRIKEALAPEIDTHVKEACVGSRPEHSFPKWQHQFEIGEYFEIPNNDSASIKEANSQILTALLGGVDHLYLRVGTLLSEQHIEALFDQVKLDYIHTTLLVNQKNDVSLPLSWNQANSTMREESSTPISINNTLNPDETIANCLNQIAKEVEKKSTPTSFTVTLRIGDSYLMEIARLRALHHTFNLLNSSCDWQHSLRIEASYAINEKSEVDYQKIANTTRGLAAILGGATLILPFGYRVFDAEEVRIARNQLHLLRLESSIDHVADPLAGSHTIEFKTDLIARAAWERLTKLQTQ